jgi:fructosamine-3-kinase
MSAFSRRVAAITGVDPTRLHRLAGGDLSEVLIVERSDGRTAVAKGGPSSGTEATMLRTLRDAGIPAPAVEAEHEGLLLLDHIENDGIFSPAAWRDIGAALQKLHSREGSGYGWPVDYRLGTVELDNRQGSDWPRFWGEQRLLPTAALLDRPWRERVEQLVARLPHLLPHSPAPALLHGDLWRGNILVAGGKLAALIDPALYHGDAEVDLAMLTLFDTPPDDFWVAYGDLASGWEQRRPIYQLFPALVHLRLFGAAYAGMVERLLAAVDQEGSSSR